MTVALIVLASVALLASVIALAYSVWRLVKAIRANSGRSGSASRLPEASELSHLNGSQEADPLLEVARQAAEASQGLSGEMRKLRVSLEAPYIEGPSVRHAHAVDLIEEDRPGGAFIRSASKQPIPEELTEVGLVPGVEDYLPEQAEHEFPIEPKSLWGYITPRSHLFEDAIRDETLSDIRGGLVDNMRVSAIEEELARSLGIHPPTVSLVKNLTNRYAVNPRRAEATQVSAKSIYRSIADLSSNEYIAHSTDGQYIVAQRSDKPDDDRHGVDSSS